jgi:hypothetical protein
MFANATRTDKIRKILPPASNPSPDQYLARASSMPPWSAIRAAVSCSPHWRQYFCSRLFSALHRGQNIKSLAFPSNYNSSDGELTSTIEGKHLTLAFSCGARSAFKLMGKGCLRSTLPRRQLQGFVRRLTAAASTREPEGRSNVMLGVTPRHCHA